MTHDPATCPCDCHDGWQRPCSVPGGCGLGAGPGGGRPADCLAKPCVVCHQPAHELGQQCAPNKRCPVKAVHLGMTCRRCYDQLATKLREIPEFYALAAGEMSLGSGGSGGHGGSETSIGLRVAALDLRSGADAIGTLAAWDRDWSEFYDEKPTDWNRRRRHHSDPVGATLVGLCGALRAGLHRACQTHPGIDVFAQEVTELHAQAKAAARANGARAVQVDCPADHLDGTCGAPLRIAGLELADAVYCRRCHTRWEVHRLLLVAAADSTATVWLTVDDVALLLGISQATLKRWAKAGRIRREHGLFDVASVRAAIRTGTTRQPDASES